MCRIRTKAVISGLSATEAADCISVFRGKTPFDSICSVPKVLRKCADPVIIRETGDAIAEYVEARPSDSTLERADATEKILSLMDLKPEKLASGTLAAIHNVINAYRDTGFHSASSWKKTCWGCLEEPLSPVSVIPEKKGPFTSDVILIMETDGNEPSGILRRLSARYLGTTVSEWHGAENLPRTCAHTVYRRGKISRRLYPDPDEASEWFLETVSGRKV